jgi:hypothetical protein
MFSLLAMKTTRTFFYDTWRLALPTAHLLLGASDLPPTHLSLDGSAMLGIMVVQLSCSPVTALLRALVCSGFQDKFFCHLVSLYLSVTCEPIYGT